MIDLVAVCRYDGTVLAETQRVLDEEYTKVIVNPALVKTDLSFESFVIGRSPSIEDIGNITRLPAERTSSIAISTTIVYAVNADDEIFDSIVRPHDTDDTALMSWSDRCLLAALGVEV